MTTPIEQFAMNLLTVATWKVPNEEREIMLPARTEGVKEMPEAHIRDFPAISLAEGNDKKSAHYLACEDAALFTNSALLLAQAILQYRNAKKGTERESTERETALCASLEAFLCRQSNIEAEQYLRLEQALEDKG